MYLQAIKSVKTHATKSVNRSILKKSQHIECSFVHALMHLPGSQIRVSHQHIHYHTPPPSIIDQLISCSPYLTVLVSSWDDKHLHWHLPSSMNKFLSIVCQLSSERDGKFNSKARATGQLGQLVLVTSFSARMTVHARIKSHKGKFSSRLNSFCI